MSSKFKFVAKQLAKSAPKLGKVHSGSTVLHFPSISGLLLYRKVDDPGGVISPGMKSACLWVLCGCGVLFLTFQFELVILQTFMILLSPKILV